MDKAIKVSPLMPIRVKTMGHKMIQMKRWSEAKIQNKAKVKKELLEAMKN